MIKPKPHIVAVKKSIKKFFIGAVFWYAQWFQFTYWDICSINRILPQEHSIYEEAVPVSTTLHSEKLDGIGNIAKAIIEYGHDHLVWWFEGNLGAGKTTLIQEICRQLGVTEKVTSPTFSIVNEYLDGDGEPLYHFDFYRVKDSLEALDIGVAEYFESGHPCLLEWASQVEEVVPEEHLKVDITVLADARREIRLTIYGPERGI